MKQPRLLDQVRDAIRLRHYSIRTEEAYTQWIRRFILFHDKKHPRAMGETEITSFLTHLAVDKHVSASTQNQALSALLFLYKEVLQMELDWLTDVVRAKRPQRLPVVLTREEVQRLLEEIPGTNGLAARLMYGTGLRLMEAIRLRIKDVDFDYRQILMWGVKQVTYCWRAALSWSRFDKIRPIAIVLLDHIFSTLHLAGRFYN
jgi:integrase